MIRKLMTWDWGLRKEEMVQVNEGPPPSPSPPPAEGLI